ncbi:MAG: hypothetical protein ACLP1X_10865 [Polyangiaceae bacterium]
MFDPFEMRREFFEGLTAVDDAIVKRAAEEPCRDCGGPLYRGDYPRKPRGGAMAGAAEGFDRRFSLCCGREGCRHRTTPPSVRFLGRRVYIGAVVIMASAVLLTTRAVRAVVAATGVPARTTRRWRRWWRGPFTKSAPFVDLSARLVPPPERSQLPVSLLERLAGEPADRVARLLTWLAPLTTTSCPDGSRFVRGAM